MSTQFYQHHVYVRRNHFTFTEGVRPWNVLFLISEGSFVFTMNGHEYTVGPNEAALFPLNVPFTRHVVTPISYHQFRFHTVSDDQSIFCPDADHCLLNLSHTYVKSMIDLLDQVYKKQLPNQEIIYQNCLDNLLMAQYIRNQAALTVRHDRDVEIAVDYMYDHLSEPIRIGDIAADLHLTHTGFIGKFKRVYGCTPNEYLVRLRMDLACRLIAEGNLRINEIATACGYANGYYFSNTFHAHVGMSPTAYRASLRE